MKSSDLDKIVRVGQDALSDAGNAKRFALKYGSDFRYNHTSGQWLFYDGIRWNPHKGRTKAHEAAMWVARSIYDEAAEAEDSKVRERLSAWAQQSESKHNIKAMLDLAQMLSPIATYWEEFDADQFLLNLQNGTLDLRTGKVRGHDPFDMISKLAPVTWNGEISEQGKGLWLRCCDTWVKGNPDAMDYLQRLGGYCLTGDISSRVFPIFWGSGKNGKNVFLDTLASILGDYAMVAPRTLLMQGSYNEHPTELASLMGKRLVIASETEPGRKLKTSLVKSMTGDKRLTARFMRQDYFEFDITHKCVLMTQNPPIIEEPTNAIWDRVQRVEWPVRIPDNKQDHQLLDKLRAEWPHILGWFLEGCLKWQKQGSLIPTKAIKESTKEYRSEMNPVAEFIEECCVIDSGQYVGTTRLRETYNQWATDKLDPTKFGALMRACGYSNKPMRLNGVLERAWLGLCLKEDDY